MKSSSFCVVAFWWIFLGLAAADDFVAGCEAGGGSRRWCLEEGAKRIPRFFSSSSHEDKEDHGEAGRRRRLRGGMAPTTTEEQARRRLSRPSGKMKLADFIGTLVCVAAAATAAGLTMGVVSFNVLELKVVQRTGDATERKQASTLLHLIDREPRHHVLVTLLLLNSAANEAMPIFLDNLVPSWAAVVLSVTVVLFVGEIGPSAICTGPNKLCVAATFAPVVRFALICLWPIAYPLSLALDRCLPEDETKKYTTRQDLRALVDVQRDDARSSGLAEPFSEDEADLIAGAMSLSSTSVADVMVPVDRVFTLSSDAHLDVATIRAVYDAGFSRIPVVSGGGGLLGGGAAAEKNHTSYTQNSGVAATGMTRYVLVKDLLLDIAKIAENNGDSNNGDSKEDGCARRIGDLPTREPVWIGPDYSLFDLLNEFQTGKTHMAFVYKQPQQQGVSSMMMKNPLQKRRQASVDDSGDPAGKREVLGVVTLEDIIEEILTEEIYDEADRANANEIIRNFLSRRAVPKLRAMIAHRKSARTHKRRDSSVGRSSSSAASSSDTTTYYFGGGEANAPLLVAPPRSRSASSGARSSAAAAAAKGGDTTKGGGGFSEQAPPTRLASPTSSSVSGISATRGDQMRRRHRRVPRYGCAVRDGTVPKLLSAARSQSAPRLVLLPRRRHNSNTSNRSTEWQRLPSPNTLQEKQSNASSNNSEDKDVV